MSGASRARSWHRISSSGPAAKSSFGVETASCGAALRAKPRARLCLDSQQLCEPWGHIGSLVRAAGQRPSSFAKILFALCFSQNEILNAQVAPQLVLVIIPFSFHSLII